MNKINILMKAGEMTKTGTLSTNFHKPTEEANMYVQFWYVPLTIW